jgi:hypothetical protein
MRMLGTLPRLAAGTALLALLGCQPSVDELVAEHRASVEGVFAKLEALDAKVKTMPPLAEDRVETGGEVIVLDGEGSNALFIQADDLASPTTASSKTPGATRASAVETCGSLLSGEFLGVAGGAKLYLEECGRAKYVFVLRTGLSEAAQVGQEKTFAKGNYAGEVLLFRIADGEALGGFRVGADSSDSVSMDRAKVDDAQAVGERLEDDLSANVFVDIDKQLRAHVPGVIRD